MKIILKNKEKVLKHIIDENLTTTEQNTEPRPPTKMKCKMRKSHMNKFNSTTCT